MLTAMLAVGACVKAGVGMDPKAEEKYGRSGLSGGHTEEISTKDGKIQATVIPAKLTDGRQVQLLIPHRPIGNSRVYLRDGIEITPIELPGSAEAAKKSPLEKDGLTARLIYDFPMRNKK